MRIGELIPITGKFMSQASVPAGKAATVELGVLGISQGIKQPTGDTSRPAIPMQRYQTVRGKTQGVAREGVEKVNPQYVKGLNKQEKDEMKREIKRFSKMDHTDKAAYPDDWDADREYKRRGGKTKPSKHTEKFHAMFGEELIDESTVDTALKNKAEKTGKSVGLLRKVYNRGLAAWRTGHRPGVSQHQWAMARVNSFLTGGKAAEVDKDLKD